MSQFAVMVPINFIYFHSVSHVSTWVASAAAAVADYSYYRIFIFYSINVPYCNFVYAIALRACERFDTIFIFFFTLNWANWIQNVVSHNHWFSNCKHRKFGEDRTIHQCIGVSAKSRIQRKFQYKTMCGKTTSIAIFRSTNWRCTESLFAIYDTSPTHAWLSRRTIIFISR